MKSSSITATGDNPVYPISHAKTVEMAGPKLNQNSNRNLNQSSRVLSNISGPTRPKTTTPAPKPTPEAKQAPAKVERVEIPAKLQFWRLRQISPQEVDVPVKTLRLDGRGCKNVGMTAPIHTNEDQKLSTHLDLKFFNQISSSAFKLLLNDG